MKIQARKSISGLELAGLCVGLGMREVNDTQYDTLATLLNGWFSGTEIPDDLLVAFVLHVQKRASEFGRVELSTGSGKTVVGVMTVAVSIGRNAEAHPASVSNAHSEDKNDEHNQV